MSPGDKNSDQDGGFHIQKNGMEDESIQEMKGLDLTLDSRIIHTGALVINMARAILIQFDLYMPTVCT